MARRDTEAFEPQGSTDWHALPADDVFAKLESKPDGLAQSDAAERLRRFGPNTMPESAPPTLLVIFGRQFRSPFIYILAIAAIFALSIGDTKDAFFIGLVLLINAIIGSYQEWKAERSTQALRKLLRIQAAVQRDGEVREVPSDELVPGDIVWIESGDRVPADIRLLSSFGLEIDESLLTGESLSVPKDAHWDGDASAPLADRINMAHAGSIVTRGRANGIVAKTGAATAVGQLAADVIGDVGGKPPLLVRMERFTNVVAVIILVSVVVISGLALASGRYTFNEIFLFAIALAVSAIPEGLPVAMTVALAVATTRMARRGVIVRRLTAVEGLGSCTYIGSDKTGTLTCNELTVREVRLASGAVFTVSGEGFTPEGEIMSEGAAVNLGDHPELDALVRTGILCNEADLHHKDSGWSFRGDAVDIALLSLGRKAGHTREKLLGQYPLVNQIPFEPELRYAATYHADGDHTLVAVKGAPERILEMAGREDADELLDVMNAMAERGLRVLALADGVAPGETGSAHAPSEPSGVRFLGYVGMIDPLRAGTREAIQQCRSAGVNVAMITGDHRETALAIARDLGMAESRDEVLTGADIAEGGPDALAEAVKRAHVFARVAPRQKLEIVEAAKRIGNFVAVTGDGVNDAPALRAANIGVSMGQSGTDVAREASEMVISDDNFSTIVAGIEEGRVAFDNIRKVIYLLVSTGAAELVLMGGALLMGSPLPLLPVQILWLNLVTNGIQHIGLAFEPKEDNVLSRPPRRHDEPIFNRLMLERTILAACAMGLVALFAFHLILPDDATDEEIAASRNGLLLLMVLFENFHLGNCRSETKSIFRLSPLRSPILLCGAIGAFLVHFTTMHLPFGRPIIGAYPISLEDWGLFIVLALTIVPVMEAHKWWWNRRHPGSRSPSAA